MGMKTKTRKIGNSYGIILPKEALNQLQVKEGDCLYIAKAPEGSVNLTASDEEFDRKMEIACKAMDRYRNALRELAK